VLDRQRSSAGTPQWGQSGAVNSIGIGTKEEQTAAFRAQKKRDMLTRQESSYADTLGKYKRRLSDDLDGVSSSVPPVGHSEHEDRDALVYLHEVRKEDTLAGIALRYNINANALRKANRMWPNDTVQTRQTLTLPVDACGVKGRPVKGPQSRPDELEVDLLGADSDDLSSLLAEEVPPPSKSLDPPIDLLSDRSRDRANSASTQRTFASSSAVIQPNDASAAPPPSWTHDSWVLLPNHHIPTEIVRLPRRAIAYFPPARRKSVSYSDNLATTPPSNSLDLARSTKATPSAGTQISSALNSTSSLNSRTPPRNASRARGSATAAPALPNRNNRNFLLSGPGGVGTLAGKNVKRPGPAQDGLNAFVAKHLPNLAITSDHPLTTSSSQPHLLPPYSDEPPPHLLLPSGTSASAQFGPASTGTSGIGGGTTNAFIAFGGNSSSSGGGGGNSGSSSSHLENVGGAIESWVRRLASKAANQFPPGATSNSSSVAAASSSSNGGGGGGTMGNAHPSSSSSSSLGPRASVGAEGRGVGGVGDLIEMTDDLDLGGDGGSSGGGGGGYLDATGANAERGRGSGLVDRSASTERTTFRSRKSGKAD
jgi:LysM repeat protein